MHLCTVAIAVFLRGVVSAAIGSLRSVSSLSLFTGTLSSSHTPIYCQKLMGCMVAIYSYVYLQYLATLTLGWGLLATLHFSDFSELVQIH